VEPGWDYKGRAKGENLIGLELATTGELYIYKPEAMQEQSLGAKVHLSTGYIVIKL